MDELLFCKEVYFLLILFEKFWVLFSNSLRGVVIFKVMFVIFVFKLVKLSFLLLLLFFVRILSFLKGLFNEKIILVFVFWNINFVYCIVCFMVLYWVVIFLIMILSFFDFGK